MSRIMFFLLAPVLALAFAGCGGGGDLLAGTATLPNQPPAPPPTVDTSPPSMPTGLAAAAANVSTINLLWTASTDNVGVTGYVVRRNGAQVATPATTSFADTGRSAGQTYTYTVAARDAAGNMSAQTAGIGATTPSMDVVSPTTPAGVRAAADGAFGIILSWNASIDDTGVTSYTVRRDGIEVATRTTTAFADLGLSPGTTYTYTVAARDAAGNFSTFSSSAIATTPVVSGTQTPLAQLAASLQPGQWGTLTTLNINPALTNTGGASGYITGDSESIKWDPVTRQLFFIGMDHGPGGQRFVSYSENTNTWKILPQTSWMNITDVSHGYDHRGLDVANRYLYVRGHFTGRTSYRYQIDTEVWEQLGNNNVLEYSQCCGGWDYFPEMNGNVWFQGGEVISGNTFFGGLFFRDDLTGSWRRLGSRATYVTGNYNNFVEYNPKHKVVIFGGGTRDLYRLNGSGGITSLGLAPVDLGNRAGVVTTDPVSGDYLVLSTTNNSFHSYDVQSNTWRLLSQSPIFQPVVNNPSIFSVVATPVSTYGVTLFVQCVSSNSCVVRLYKHNGG